MVQDVKFAVRQLWRDRELALVALASLSLGIGAATAVFSAIYGFLWSPYPYKGADRMVKFANVKNSGQSGGFAATGTLFREILRLHSLDGAVIWDRWDGSTSLDGVPETVHVAYLSPNAFQFFGVSPLIGRVFTDNVSDADDTLKSTVVLSYRYWHSHFGGAPSVMGRGLRIDQRIYSVSGVMPERFRFLDSDVYVKLAVTDSKERIYDLAARLKPGFTYEAASMDMGALLRHFAEQTNDPLPKDFKTIRLKNIREDAVTKFGGTRGLLFGAVPVLLLIGCGNVSILLVARGTRRRGELAIRRALGASEARISRQLVSEALVLSLAGGIGGAALSRAFLSLILHGMPDGMVPGDIRIEINFQVLVFATIVAILSGLVSGLWPALNLCRMKFSIATQFNLRGDSTGAGRAHSLLIAGQIAVILLLLASAGAAVKTFLTLSKARLDYDPSGVAVMGISLSDSSFATWTRRVAYYNALRNAVAGIPGVDSVAIGNLPPLFPPRVRVKIPEQSLESESVVLQEVSREYFSTLHIPLLHGRIWTEAETAHATGSVIINESMAHQYWPNANPVGRRIYAEAFLHNGKNAANGWLVVPSTANDASAEVIGVAADVQNNGLRGTRLPAIYRVYTQHLWDQTTLLVRSRASFAFIAENSRRRIAAVNGAQSVNPIRTAEETLQLAGWAREQFVALLFVLFASLALLLGAVGLYSVIAYSVAQRIHEFGFRMVLGASRIRIVATVFSSVTAAVVSGFFCGISATLILDGVIAQWTGSSPSSGDTLIPVIAMLAVVSTSAIAIPARIGASSQPMDILRCDR